MGLVAVSLPGHRVTKLGGIGTREDPRLVTVVMLMVATSLLAFPDNPCPHTDSWRPFYKTACARHGA